MIKHYLITVVIGIYSCLLVATPAEVALRLLGVGPKKGNLIWARVLGWLGFLWIAVGLAASGKLTFLHTTPAGRELLVMVKHTCGGAICGFVLATWLKESEERRNK